MPTTTKTKRAERGCLSVDAPTVREAKAGLETLIDTALKGYYTPETIRHGRYVAFLYRTPNGWTYKLLDLVDVPTGLNYAGGCAGEDQDYEKVKQGAIFHVLDVGSHRTEFFTDADIPAMLADKNLRGQLISNARFQRAYFWAKGKYPNLTHTELHRLACDHANDVEFCQRPAENGML